MKRPRISYRRANNVILAIIILLNLYVILAPFVPGLLFKLQVRHDGHEVARLTQKIDSLGSTAGPSGTQPNQVIIPSILLDQTINEGHETYVELAKGVWRWPNGSTPPAGGNTILIGHRFTYTSPRGVFYELNEVKMGDLIGVIWNNRTYDYIVTSIDEDSPDDTAILNQTAQPELTLYTCAPLLVPKYRLVVVAKLESQS